MFVTLDLAKISLYTKSINYKRNGKNLKRHFIKEAGRMASCPGNLMDRGAWWATQRELALTGSYSSGQPKAAQELGILGGKTAGKTNLSTLPFCLRRALVKVINLKPQDESHQHGAIYTSDPYSCFCSKGTDL